MPKGALVRALVLEEFGATPKISEVPAPEPGAGEVLVGVQAASLNGFDLAVAGGFLEGMMEHRFPVVIGKDFAGTVEAVGAGVEGFAPGDQVFGVVMKPELHDGSIGEYVAVPAAFCIAHRPAGVSPADAGALGLAGAAALASVESAEVGDGDTVLVSGATGGVGSFSVQLAAARGARVLATARPGGDAELVRELGAQIAVDYTADLAAQVRALAPEGVDVVLHLAGDAGSLLELVTGGGRLASTLGFDQEQAGDRNVVVSAVRATPDAETLTRLASEVGSGALRVVVQRTYSLGDAPAALRDFGEGTRGKLAIEIA
jgi:NADPH:quinone reductase-like Zn-dependent oxidoreductase